MAKTVKLTGTLDETKLTGTLEIIDELPIPIPTPIPTGGVRPPFLYSSSVTGTDFEFNMDSDPSAFQSLVFLGLQNFEMPTKGVTPKPPLVQQAYVYNCIFKDGTSMKIAMSKDFGSSAAAHADVDRYTLKLGRLPLLYRSKLKHMVVQKGGVDTTAMAEDKGHFFVIYSDNATKRIDTHDLEDTFFHEASHASIQFDYVTSAAWIAAKAADVVFITDYARSDAGEDFAESALFAYILMKYPERFPMVDRVKIEAQIPNRIAFFRTIFV